MNKIDTSFITTGSGYPPSKKGLDFMQNANMQIFKALAQAFTGVDTYDGNFYVLWGCLKTPNGGNWDFSDGFIYDTNTGEVYQFTGATNIALPATAILNFTNTADAVADPTIFTDGTSRNVHRNVKLTVTNGTSGTGEVDYNDLIFVNQVKEKVIEIGAWDMDSTASLNKAHGLSDISKIISCNIFIHADDPSSTNSRELNYTTDSQVSGYFTINSTNIVMARVASPGVFDSTNYNDTGVNRGYIYIKYLGF